MIRLLLPGIGSIATLDLVGAGPQRYLAQLKGLEPTARYSEFPLKLNCSASPVVGLLAVADLGR